MSSSGSGVRAAYDRWAQQYESDENATRDLNARVLRERLQFDGDEHILEVGCGTGLNSEWLAAKAGHLVATDVSEEMLARARERLDCESVTVQNVDVTEPWPFEAGRFDAIVATLVLEHMGSLTPIFRQARRVLRDRGTFYLAELHSYRQLVGTQANFCDEETGEEVRVPAYRHTVSEFINEAVAAGLSVQAMGELRAEGDEQPRLLTIHFEVVPDGAGS